MLSHKELRAKMFEDPEFRAEYERLEPEYSLLDELLKAKEASGLSQAEIARRMGTKPPALSRMIAGVGSESHSPSIATLRKYAEACGMKLRIHMVK
ncbi:MAG: helix-turn-helix domain-containing protein [Desulfobulbus sp.]